MPFALQMFVLLIMTVVEHANISAFNKVNLILKDTTKRQFVLNENLNLRFNKHEDVEEIDNKLSQKISDSPYIQQSAENNPYSVMLFIYFRRTTSSLETFCTGTLVTPDWVLTSSQCFQITAHFVIVYAGGNNPLEFLEESLPSGSQVRNSTALHDLRGSYNPLTSTDEYDPDIETLTLIKVNESFELTTTVNTIKLSPKPWRYSGFKNCILTGFGQSKRGDQEEVYFRKTYFLEVELPCECNHGVSGNDGMFFCSRPRHGFGICRGDVGSALVCEEEVVGVAYSVYDVRTCSSWGEVCRTQHSTSMFTYLCPYLAWINNFTFIVDSGNLDQECLRSIPESNDGSCHNNCVEMTSAGGQTPMFGLCLILFIAVFSYKT